MTDIQALAVIFLLYVIWSAILIGNLQARMKRLERKIGITK